MDLSGPVPKKQWLKETSKSLAMGHPKQIVKKAWNLAWCLLLSEKQSYDSFQAFGFNSGLDF